MADLDRRISTHAAGKHEAEAETAPLNTPKQSPSAHPAPIPPNHILVGGDSPLGEDPVAGSVVSEDWGHAASPEPDVDESTMKVLGEDSVV